MVARRARWRKAEQFIPIYGRRLRKRELGSELDEPRGSSFVILSAAKNPGSFSTLNTAASTTDRSRFAMRKDLERSASRAFSEVEAFCAEKDPGFFAALRMTENLVPIIANVASDPTPNPSHGGRGTGWKPAAANARLASGYLSRRERSSRVRATGEGASIQLDASALTRRSRTHVDLSRRER
jgi:hypothetical protein